MLSAVSLDSFHLPVGCPRPAGTAKPTKEHIKGWLDNEGKDAGFLKRTSYGTYAGLCVAAIGLVSNFLGFAKDSKVCKFLGSALAVVGLGVAAFGKLFGYDVDMFGKMVDKATYSPPAKINDTPRAHEVPYEPVAIHKNGETLMGYYMPAPKETKKTVLYLHGRANNIGDCIPDVVEIQKKLPVNVLMVDYRGFGQSSLNAGKITPGGLVEDAKAMYDYLISEKGCMPDDITALGHSLGGGVAVELTKDPNYRVDNLIIMNSFAKLSDVLGDFLSWVVPKSWKGKADKVAAWVLSDNEFNSLEGIKQAHAKHVLIGHGKLPNKTSDGIIDCKQAEELHKARPDSELIVFEGAGHSDYVKHLDDTHYALLNKLIFGSNGIQEIVVEAPEPLPQVVTA